MSSVDDVPWYEDEVDGLTIQLNKINNTQKENKTMSTFADKFKALKASQDEVASVVEQYEEKGSIGGGKKFSIDEDGVYVALIDMVTWNESKNGASCWYELTLKTEDERKIRTKMFVINKDGLTYRVDKEGRTRNNPDFSRMAGINFIVNGEWDGLPVPEEREVMVYDYDARTEIAKTMPIVPSLIGKPIGIAVKMVLEDGYPDETVSRTVAEIRNFLDPVDFKSATELREGKDAQVVEDFKKSIEKSPAPLDKRKKSKDGATASTTSNAPKKPAAGSFGFSK